MAFIEPTEALPNNDDLCKVKIVLFQGIEKEAQYKSANQVFVVASSGLRVPAYRILEWELIP